MPQGVNNHKPERDLATYQRTRIWRLERENRALRHTNDQLIRVTGMMLQDWFRDTTVDPMTYLHAWVDIDHSCQELGL